MEEVLDLDECYERIDKLWSENRLEDAVKVAEEAAKKAPYFSEPLVWLGDLHYEMEQWDEALKYYASALEVEPGLASALSGMGRIHYERGGFADAEPLIDDALGDDREYAEANYYKALLLERKGEFKKADKFLERAHSLDPESFPSTFKIPLKEFEVYIEEVLESLTPKVKNYLKNVAVIVQEVPDDNDLFAEEPPLSPHLLGLFRGSSARERSTESAWSQMPCQIVLYKRNLEHFCQDRDELVEQIRVTMLHEIGHYLGLNEGDLEKRGLE